MLRCGSLLSLAVLTFLVPSVIAQDPAAAAAQAAQQASQDAIRANQDAMRATQEANERASQQAQQTMQNTNTATVPAVGVTAPPTFSVKAGVVQKGTVVRLKTRTHYATIYYTTDGWTPTTDSPRYTGPITIDSTTHVQAIAIAPNLVRSIVSSAKYTVPGSMAREEAPAIVTDGVLRAGTALRFVTGASLNSRTAQVGDSLKLVLDQDVSVGDTVVIRKGTVVDALVTLADPAAPAGTPGDIAFEVQPLKIGNAEIPLSGGQTIEGPNHYGRTLGVLLVPVVGIAGVAVHGGQAEIKPGMPLWATVSADVSLQPLVTSSLSCPDQKEPCDSGL